MAKLFHACRDFAESRHILVSFRHGFWACEVALVAPVLLVLLLLPLSAIHTLLVIYTLTLFPPEAEG